MPWEGNLRCGELLSARKMRHGRTWVFFVLYTMKVLWYNSLKIRGLPAKAEENRHGVNSVFTNKLQKEGKTLNRKLKDEDMDILFRGILKLSTVEECYDFFEDLCTISELRAMVQRFQVARMLDEGRIYSDIVQETGASTATISRVNKCLVYGSDGYRRMLDRLKEDNE